MPGPSADATITVRCPAKLNLFLEVVGKRADGYHDLDTVMQAIDLCDELHVTPCEDAEELSLACSDPELPTDSGNLVLRAALALREHTGCRKGARFELTKRIPMQAGLGGGSSDAAGALVGLNAAWGLGLATEELRHVAATVGSDVAFFLYGGTARCTGRGEVVEPAPAPAVFHYVLVCPGVGVSTAEAYARLASLTYPRPRASIVVLAAIADGSFEGTGKGLFNRLEDAALTVRPELREVKQRLAETGLFAGVAMTGSGSGFFGLCHPSDWERAHDTAARLALGRAFAVRSLPHGVAAVPATGLVRP